MTIQEFLLNGSHSDARMYLRRKSNLAPSATAQGVVLCVHGATYGATHTFDYPVGDRSWMDHLARSGFDVWCLDLTGYGLAERPFVMNEPAHQHPPLMTTEEAVTEVGLAVDFILAESQASAISLIGYSWGTVLCGTYAGREPSRINRLILLGALWVEPQPKAVMAPLPAYRTVTADAALQRWSTGLSKATFAQIIDPRLAETWCQQAIEQDPRFDPQQHNYLRAPTGVIADFQRCAATGEAWYEPGAITAPTLIIVGSYDIETTPLQAMTVFQRLAPNLDKHLTVLANATHSVLLERRRDELFSTSSQFLF